MRVQGRGGRAQLGTAGWVRAGGLRGRCEGSGEGRAGSARGGEEAWSQEAATNLI